MKPYGIRKKDDDCCPGHAKYGVRGLTAKGVKRPRLFSKDKPRKAKIRQYLQKYRDNEEWEWDRYDELESDYLIYQDNE